MGIDAERRLTEALAGSERVRRRHPTRWWRHHLAQDYDARTVRRMRACLAKYDIVREAGWFAAATGDAAAAIGLALKYRPVGCPRPEFDFAMTALAISALRGSTAARVVMSKMLRWLPDAGQAEIQVANSWLMLAYARRNREPWARDVNSRGLG
jgi:hypothetical protein